MTIVNKYINDSKHVESRIMAGDTQYQAVGTFEVAAADDNGSIYRVATIPSNAIITNILVNNDAITSGTDYDIGVYKTTTDGAVVDANYFADALDLSSDHICGSELSGIKDMPVEYRSSNLYTMLGLTLETSDDVYDIAFTANAVGSVAGTISYIIEYLA